MISRRPVYREWLIFGITALGVADRTSPRAHNSPCCHFAPERPPALIGVKMTKRSQFVARRPNELVPSNRGQPRNARLSTGPVTEEGKRRSRQNALRHGLTAETVIDAAEDYVAFEIAVTADYDAQSAVERELVRLASLLWRLRRATAIESARRSSTARNETA
jgi:hypothetical protein